MANALYFGVTGSSVCHHSFDEPLDADTQFGMVKESGAFDYFDKTPAEHEIADYLAAIEKHDLPMRSGGWFYALGVDEELLRTHLRSASALGANAQNVQIAPNRSDGTPLTDQAQSATTSTAVSSSAAPSDERKPALPQPRRPREASPDGR